jgi:hypothetical protein
LGDSKEGAIVDVFSIPFSNKCQITIEFLIILYHLDSKSVKPSFNYRISSNISIGSLYKLLAKILANRLSRVMNSINIAKNQSGFIEGKFLADEVLGK